jgi:hypothetical protein
MKKLLSIALVLAGLSMSNTTKASSYVLDEIAVTTTINNATEESLESFTSVSNSESNNFTSATAVVKGDQSKGVFLVAAFFCGGFAIHRFYMGVNGKGGIIFLSNFCLFGVPALIDFIYVLIDDSNFSKYDNSSEIFVWSK